MAVRDTQHHLVHYMIMGRIRGDLAKELTGYLCKACRFHLCLLCRNLVSEPEKHISELKTQIPKLPPHEQVSQAWISDKTWLSIDARVTDFRKGGQKNVWKISQQIRAGLITDQKRRTEEAGRTIEFLLVWYPPPFKRGMGPDAGLVQGCSR